MVGLRKLDPPYKNVSLSAQDSIACCAVELPSTVSVSCADLRSILVKLLPIG